MDGAFMTLTFPTIIADASTYTAKTGSYESRGNHRKNPNHQGK